MSFELGLPICPQQFLMRRVNAAFVLLELSLLWIGIDKCMINLIRDF